MKLKAVKDQVVVVVGASSGIGRAAAFRFAERGARVVAAGRSLADLENLAGEIQRRGGQASAFEADVSDFDQVKAIANFAVETFGRIDTWVHLAAVSIYAAFADTTPSEFKRVIEVNLLGQVYGAMAALPFLKREGRGSLIHISSVEARRSFPLQSAYSSSKHGMVGFIDALRLEVQHEGLPINVVNILPASMDTPLFEKARTRMGFEPRPIPPVYDPQLVVNAILYAAENPARDLMVGSGGKALDLLQKVSPSLADKMLNAGAYRGQRTDRPKPANAPNNLYNHLPGYDRIYGEYGEEAKNVRLTPWSQMKPVAKWGVLASALAAVSVVAARAYRPQSPLEAVGARLAGRWDALKRFRLKKLLRR